MSGFEILPHGGRWHAIGVTEGARAAVGVAVVTRCPSTMLRMVPLPQQAGGGI